LRLAVCTARRTDGLSTPQGRIIGHEVCKSLTAHNCALCPRARKRKNYLFAGSDAGESKLLTAAAYDRPGRRLYLRFHSGEVYCYFTFPADQYREFLDAG